MDTTFFINDLDNPVTLDFPSVKLVLSDSKVTLKDFSAKADKEEYHFRFLNPERNSRLNALLPESDLWEVKWITALNSTFSPWYLLINKNRILLQTEADWQLFEITGKKIAQGVRARGEIILSESEQIFYVNDHSGFIQAVDLLSGKRIFYVYPFLGKGFERSVIYTNGTRIISKAFELPVMTHNTSIQIPELNILEILNLSSSRDTDEDGILKSSPGNEKLIIKSGKILSAVHDSIIIVSVQDHIYIIDDKLHVSKDFTESFVPLEMSLDEEMRIYLLVDIQSGENWRTEYWMLDTSGNIFCKTPIPPVQKNYLAPPAIDFKHNAYVMYEEKIIAINPSGEILWEEYIQKPLSGITAGKDHLLVCEGNLLTSFNQKGVRKFIYNFNEGLAAPPILYKDQLYVVTASNLYCLTPKR